MTGDANRSEFKLTLAEQETVFYICAADRSIIVIYSDDPVWQARLEREGLVGVAVGNGPGMEYQVGSKWLRVRKPKQLSEAQRIALLSGGKSGKQGIVEDEETTDEE